MHCPYKVTQSHFGSSNKRNIVLSLQKGTLLYHYKMVTSLSTQKGQLFIITKQLIPCHCKGPMPAKTQESLPCQCKKVFVCQYCNFTVFTNGHFLSQTVYYPVKGILPDKYDTFCQQIIPCQRDTSLSKGILHYIWGTSLSKGILPCKGDAFSQKRYLPFNMEIYCQIGHFPIKEILQSGPEAENVDRHK